MKTSLNSPTKYEQTRIDAMRKLGCCACAVLGVPNLNQLELHHILSGGVRMGHYFSVFLCRGHHQGDWSSLQWIEPDKRVAISDGRKLFTAVYGTERSLWEKVQTKLKLPAVWPVSKIVPRREHGLVQSGVAVSERPAGMAQAHPQGAPGGAGLLPGDLAQDRRDPGCTS
jgi:Recombination enhancement, RecA-dependent nuclease